MTMKLLSPSSASNPRWAKSLFFFTSNPKGSEPISNSTNFFNGEPLRMAGVDIFAEMGVGVTVEDFVSFMGTDGNLMGSSCSFTAEFIQCISEANYLGGVANVKGVKGYGPDRGGKEKVLMQNRIPELDFQVPLNSSLSVKTKA
ncbi:hypothetical protein NC651_012296 [Populus alba x Populus x berolinensis]|nr:hypothetical protein NC651_012296 [Populus alba x Populus x berolinensis]